jgi:hypothetical protein
MQHSPGSPLAPNAPFVPIERGEPSNDVGGCHVVSYRGEGEDLPQEDKNLLERLAELPWGARFLAKIDRSGECWRWTAAVTAPNHKARCGYGVFKLGGKQRYAHRIACQVAHGDPGERHVLHRCDDPRCVRPSHMFTGTHADNMADKVAKGRQVRGVAHWSARLTESQVLDIVSRATAGERQVDLATEFSVGRTAINHIVVGRTWSSVTGRGVELGR